MELDGSGVDFGGARGSNAGDVFHELWAVRHALRLLNASDGLTAVEVEGTRASGIPDRMWDGVDCTLLFGADGVADAKRVKVQQLKYSGSNPNRRWTVARVCAGKKGTPKGSLVRKLGTAFRALVESRKGKPLDTIKVSLVTNQPVASELVAAIGSAREGVPVDFNRPWKTGGSKLHRLVQASGLDASEFSRFASVVDFHGETGSRFAIEEGVLREIAQWSETEFMEVSLRLRHFVRERMLPETANEPITKELVLLQFRVSDVRALFPCPSSLEPEEDAVSRRAAMDVATALTQGVRKICLHGGAGVGKTTVLQEIDRLLPDGSEMIAFDCYGAGSYLDASRLRHRPREAFVQLSNEISQRMRLPALLVPAPGQDLGRAFRQRLELAADALSGVCADGLLVLAIDAADNSIAAATARGGGESSFVTELMSMKNLPANVRVIVSARTGWLEELNAPPDYRKMELPGFELTETAANVARHWNAPPEWIEDFHSLSGGVPRVQGYAFRHAGTDSSGAIEYLMPSGKSLVDVFGELFDGARNKAGGPGAIEKMCAGLTTLPRPIPVAELAQAIDVSEWDVRDVCTDLAPGVRLHEGYVSFADEDFEAYVRDQGTAFGESIRIRLAERFLANAERDEYAAFNVADQLLAAGKSVELLNLVEQEPEPGSAVMPDPVLRREVRDHRLLTAVRVCREAGNVAGALRFVLIAAEAVGSSEATRSLLADYPRLTAKFARDAGSRLILESPDHVSNHGGLLFSCLSEDAAKRDRVAVRENWRRLQAWFEARDDVRKSDDARRRRRARWPVSGEDVASAVLATAILRGADAAVAHFKTLKPFGFRARVGKALVERLLAENRFDVAEEMAERCRPWQSVFLLVPLARAGRDIDLEQLARSLTGLKRRFSLDAELLNRSNVENQIGPYVIDTVLSAAELLSGHDSYREIAESILEPFLDRELRRVDRRHEFEVPLLDAILRACCLREALNGNEADASCVLVAAPEPEDDGRPGNRWRRDDSSERRLKQVISAIVSTYAHRAAIMAGAGERECGDVDVKPFRGSFPDWQLGSSRYAPRYRAMLGERLTDLIAVGANAKDILTCALEFCGGFWPEGPGGVDELCTRLAAVPALHDELISKICDASASTLEERTRAQDKTRTLAAYATLLLPMSADDSRIVYGMAARVASDVDDEAMHQIRLLERIVENGRNAFGEGRRARALAIAEIVGDAAIRLGDQDYFPWDEAMSCIARLDGAVALASVARWDDAGTASAGMTLPSVVSVGLREKYFNSVQAAGLIVLDRRPPLELLRTLLDEAQRDSSRLAGALAEELAHDSVVGRIPFEVSLEPVIGRYGNGQWTADLQARAEYLREEAKPEEPQELKDIEKGIAAFLSAHQWDASRLLDTDTLLKEANDVVDRLRNAGLYGFLERVLDDASGAVPPGKRTEFLDALAGVLEAEPDGQIANVLLRAAQDWQGQLAVRAWCKVKLPELFARHLPTFVRYLPWEDSRMSPAMDIVADSGGDPMSGMLEGIERNVESMGARTLFGVAGLMGSKLDPADSAGLCEWYVERLLARVPDRDRENVSDSDVPVQASEAVGRFLYAYMGDVELRQRWRAAHALRRLARFGEASTVREIVAQYERLEEPSFRALGQPFYWLAARLWLVIALDRAAGEKAGAVKPHAEELLEICFSEEFPHLPIRDYAADACRKLVASGDLRLDSAQQSKLDSVNRGRLAGKRRPWRREPSESLGWGHPDRSTLRFDFDFTDTLPYWYDPWLRVFDGVSGLDFVRRAEAWIVDRWGVTEKPSRSWEGRRNRFPDRSYHLSSHGHGSLPTIEHYKTHLEWHAMWCVAGELAAMNPVFRSEFGDVDRLTERISRAKLTHAPYWLSDIAAAVPLQMHRRRLTEENLENWLCSVADDDFLRELFPNDRTGWVCVSAGIKAGSYDRDEKVEICTGLVSPTTASALVRALQTAQNRHLFYICPEGHDAEIKAPPYELRGWLTGSSEDLKFDRKDPFCGAGGTLHDLPGARVRRVLGLERRYRKGRFEWSREGAESASFVYETWGPRERNRQSAVHGDPPAFSGYRLLARKHDLAEFLEAEGLDLVAEIGITRHDRRAPRTSFDPENPGRGEFNRIVLLRRSGALEAAGRSFEAWDSDCPRT